MAHSVSSSRRAGAEAPARPMGYVTAGEGPPVVLLHSSLASKSQWAGLVERLATRYRAIAIDLCGYGDAALPANRASFSMDDETRRVSALLAALVPAHMRLHVVGHSYGAVVAMRFAQLHRARVASLSLYEPVAFPLLDAGARAEVEHLAVSVARHVEEGRLHDATREFVDFWSGDGGFAHLPLPVQSRMAQRIAKAPLDFRAANGVAIDVGAIDMPTLLLAGTRSPEVAQRIATALIRLLPQRRAAWVDAGHMGPVTHARAVDPLIQAFIDARDEHDRAAGAVRAAATPRPWSALAY